MRRFGRDPIHAIDRAMTGPHAIAAIANSARQDAQSLLSDAAAGLLDAGFRVVGVLAESNDVEGACSAAFLRDIASGRRFSIQLDAAPAGTTCHLDAAGINEACAGMLPQIAGADVVLLSKFGKTEALRQGLWEAFSSAISAGKPLLTTVSPKHVEAWTAFAPEAGWLEPHSCSIEQWWQAAKASASRRPDAVRSR